MEVNGNGKHYRLLQYGNNYIRKMFYSTGYRVGSLKLSVVDIKLFYLLPDVVAK
jgi:hypothetical protein